MSRIEGFVVREAVSKAKAAGWFVRPLCWTGSRDAPDRFFLKDGRTVLIEFKSPGVKPRPGQVNEIAEIKRHGGEVYVCDTVHAALVALKIIAPE